MKQFGLTDFDRLFKNGMGRRGGGGVERTVWTTSGSATKILKPFFSLKWDIILKWTYYFSDSIV